jgi:hypothetical protein
VSTADVELGQYPNEYLGVSAHTNGTTATQENELQAPLKLNSEAFSGVNTVGASFHSGSGTPQGNLAAGQGAFYFRWDTPSTANQRLYICTVGGATASATTWIAIL